VRIKTNYDCEIEPKDVANLQRGHALTATLSDGSVAFRFHMDPALLETGPVRVVGLERTPPPLLTDGSQPKKKVYTHRGTCPYCHRGPLVLEAHIRVKHPDKPLHPAGKHRCPQCPQRFNSVQSLALHTRVRHGKKGKE
jgi:hypothetical protein